jgi:uncharacterized protein
MRETWSMSGCRTEAKAMTDVTELLDRVKTIAVVGCSTNHYKAAHHVPVTVQEAGFRVIPVHPTADEILGEPAYPRLADVPDEIDMVNVFRPSAEAAGVVRQAAELGIGAVWLQTGVTSLEGRAIAAAAGMDYVENRCLGVDVQRMAWRRR